MVKKKLYNEQEQQFKNQHYYPQEPKDKTHRCKLVGNKIWARKDVEFLNLSGFKIIEVLPTIKLLINLKKVDLSRNLLKKLPEDMHQLKLTYLNIANNDFTEPPFRFISGFTNLESLYLDCCYWNIETAMEKPPFYREKNRRKVCLNEIFALNEMLKKCTNLQSFTAPCGRHYGFYSCMPLNNLKDYLDLACKFTVAFNSNKTPPELSFVLFRNYLYKPIPKTYCRCQPVATRSDGSIAKRLTVGWEYKYGGSHKPFCYYVPNLNPSLFDLSENKLEI
ncbi:leucine-rich repeat domain-containing protein [Candidatus Babeliales bacterium]|nr:leucine-rich repeat domain-containing protein [Candidatus Babeliales bacterium]